MDSMTFAEDPEIGHKYLLDDGRTIDVTGTTVAEDGHTRIFFKIDGITSKDFISEKQFHEKALREVKPEDVP